MRKIISVPQLCGVHRESTGRFWHSVDRDGASPRIEVWWDRSGEKSAELLFVRQETDGAPQADVVGLTLSQLYALIDALNRSVMTR